MKLSLRTLLPCVLVAFVLFSATSCTTTTDNTNSNTTRTAAPTASPSPLALTVASRPQRISDMMAERGQQDEAAPELTIAEPRDGATVNSSTVRLRLNLGGDLKGYKPGKDPQTNMGNHIHVILDNQPYEAYYDLSQPFELRNVTDGQHTIRVFASRPWHESYKNEGSFKMVTFTVSGGGADASKPTTTATGQTMADNRNAAASASPAASPSPAREGKDMAASQAGNVDRTKPLLTYSRPKGEYKGAEADPIMIDFWLTNAKLQGDGGEYRVRYSVGGGEPRFIDKWEPVWLSGWTGGNHTVRLELVDRSGNVVENGGYNSTTRDITVSK